MLDRSSRPLTELLRLRRLGPVETGTFKSIHEMSIAGISSTRWQPHTVVIAALPRQLIRWTEYEDAVFQCRDHMMTAINATGYGAIYLTPNHLVDFRNGESVVRFDVSTLRTSHRDWIDILLTPFGENQALPGESFFPDLSGPPRNSLHVRLDPNNSFSGRIRTDFHDTELSVNDYRGYDAVIAPSGMRRDTFELRVSRGRVRFGMPDMNLWWIDTTIADLGWNQAVLQLGHHSYNPTKCNDIECGPLAPNTWHWDNVSISASRPFTMLHGDRRYADQNADTIRFTAAAPDSAFLRFAGIGDDLEVTFDGGLTWVPATMQLQDPSLIVTEHFKSYWMSIPAGIEQVAFRGTNWWGGNWRVKDLSIWSLNSTFSSCDFNTDGQCDVRDLNLMFAEGSLLEGIEVVADQNQRFDLNADGILDLQDRDLWLAVAADERALSEPFLLGDANLDGNVDASDFNIWNGNKYTTSTDWSRGNFNGDGAIDAQDFNLWNANKFQSSAAMVTVPESLNHALYFAWLAMILMSSRRESMFRRRL